MRRRIGRGALLALVAVVLAAVVLEGTLQIVARVVASHRGDDDGTLGSAPIVVYGDSTPYGLGNDVRFADEIARLGDVVVANRSWPGLNSTQVARIVHQDLASISPRVLIVMAGVNDGWNIEDVPAALLGNAARMQRRLPRLRVVRLFRLGLEAGLGGHGLDSNVVSGWSDREETARLLPAEAIRRIQSASYAAMLRDADARHAEVLFLGYQAEGYNHVGDLAEDVLRSEHADRLVALRDLFVDHGERRMIQADQFHPTDDGQRAIATRVLAALRARGWLDDARSSMPSR
jgi:lysophospholipase L1-like esterase